MKQKKTNKSHFEFKEMQQVRFFIWSELNLKIYNVSDFKLNIF